MTPGATTRWLEAGDRVAEKYEVVRLIGQGGMGAVYEVAHQVTGKRFALKWMVPELAGSKIAGERFRREAQSACALEHPNVVQIFDIDQHDGGMYSLMQLLTGESLDARMAHGPLPAEAVVRLLLPLLHGLHEAHRTGIVHRDLKPENIFLARDRPDTAERPMLLDFGLSKLIHRERDAEHRLTRTGTVMGTPAYMSPEQARDAAVVDQRADVWAIGVVMYEALTGRVPFEGSSIPTLLLKICQDPPTQPRELVPSIPAALEAVVLRCLAKAPEDRPPSAEALASELCEALGLPRGLFRPGPSTADAESWALAPTKKAVQLPEARAGLATDTERDWRSSAAEPTTAQLRRLTGPRTGRLVAVLAAILTLGALGTLAVFGLAASEDRRAERDDTVATGSGRGGSEVDEPPVDAGVEIAEDGEPTEPLEIPVPPMGLAAPEQTPLDPPVEVEPTRTRTRPRRSRGATRPTAPRPESPETPPTPRLETGNLGVGDF